jgi:hypothetical protein
MPWLEQKKSWLKQAKQSAAAQKIIDERVYSITDVAQILAVTRQTVYKWLSIDEPEDAVIPPEAWFKLPSGHIRIREWIVAKIKKGEV